MTFRVILLKQTKKIHIYIMKEEKRCKERKELSV